MKLKLLTFSGVWILALLCAPSLALAQLSSFAVLGGSTVTNTNTPTVVTGNLGVSPGSAVTGFPPGIVTGGTIHTADAVAGQAQVDLTTVYNTVAGLPCTTDLTGQNLGGLTLTPGVYCFSTSAQLTGTLTLNAQGISNAAFAFKMGSTLTTASASSVLLINGGSACGVYWQVGSSATLGTGTSLLGTIAALTSITLNTGANLNGRALARNGAVTLDSNNASDCTGGPGLPGLPGFNGVFGTSNTNTNALGTPALTMPVLAGLALLLAGLGWVLLSKAKAL
ncbi:MAG TPA: ice-binding family protein [Bryobacteraceae bacterium]|nr:ice-binding family protein [Bryobacteraceae bacterium]